MNKISRQSLICAFMLILVSSACGTSGQVPSQAGLGATTELPPSSTPGPVHSGQPTDLAIVPLIPITGENVASMQCQFCVNNQTYAVLIFPDFAYFDVVSSSPVHCSTAEVVNGRRILICRGAPSTTFSLNICSDSTNCLQFPVALQPCDALQAGNSLETPFSPVFLTPVNPANNQDPGSPANPSQPSLPPGSGLATATSLPPVVPTDPPTNEPPLPTAAPTQGGGEEEIVICHIPPGNPDNGKTMSVTLSAWQNEHSRHGDTRGACD